jgi:hypothetical protein
VRGAAPLAAALADTLARWVEGTLQAHPGLDHWLERHAHAYGLHGPYLRHVLKSRLAPVVVVVAVVALVLVVGVWRSRRAAARPSRHSPS